MSLTSISLPFKQWQAGYTYLPNPASSPTCGLNMDGASKRTHCNLLGLRVLIHQIICLHCLSLKKRLVVSDENYYSQYIYDETDVSQKIWMSYVILMIILCEDSDLDQKDDTEWMLDCLNILIWLATIWRADCIYRSVNSSKLISKHKPYCMYI